MDQTQTASDYKQYFSNKFISLFSQLTDYIISQLPLNSQTINDLEKIKSYGEKLNYNKIIPKLALNNKLIEITGLLSKIECDDDTYYRYFKNKEKYWSILPTFDINTIILQISSRLIHNEIFKKINELYVCAVTYNKVIEQIIKSENEGNEFNPFESIGNTSSINIDTLFKGVEVKNISALDMIMGQLINSDMEHKMDEYMNNMKESDVNDAAAKLTEVLEGDNFKGNKQTSKLLSEMLDSIKGEVINLKNTTSGTNTNQTNNNQANNKQGVEQLLGIAQKVAGNMMGRIKDSDIGMMEIWDATSSLAKNTVKSDAFNIVDNMIRSTIVQNMNSQYNELQPNQNDTELTQTQTQNQTQSVPNDFIPKELKRTRETKGSKNSSKIDKYSEF